MNRAAGHLFAGVTMIAASGCVVAAAGAGAGGGIYLTSRGVESIVTSSLEEASDATERAFDELDITRTGVDIDDEDARRVYRGEPADGGPDVTVTLETQDSGSVKVEVTARRSAVTWDKDYARRVLERIVAGAS